MRINLQTDKGVLEEKYSKYAEDKFRYNSMPNLSFPFEITDFPKNTKTFALTFIDHDAYSVVSFSFVHWLACNIFEASITENISARNENITQGRNSFSSSFIGVEDIIITNRYIGPTPPDKNHEYTLTVYALDKELDLEEGYMLNEFFREIKGHVLDMLEEIVVGRF